MVSFTQLLVVAAALTTAYGQNLNVTNSAQDYFLISQRELLHDIEIAELKNEAFDARFADRLAVIHIQEDQVLAEINRVNQTLMPLQALSVVRKHCIQKYDKQLITYEKAKTQLDYCYNRAALNGPSLTSSPKSSVNSARNYVLNILPRSVAACDNNYSNNQTALELCYISEIDSDSQVTQNYLNNAEQQLQRSEYDADVITKTAVQCSFQVEKDVLETIAVTTQDIDICELDLKQKSNTPLVQSMFERKSIKNLLGVN